MLFSEIAEKCETEGYKLGLKPEEFWNMIPIDFYKFHKSRIEMFKFEIKNKQKLAGLICATIANFAPYKKSKKYKIEDFIGKEKTKQSEEEMLRTVKRLNRTFRGEEVNINGNC